MAMEAHPFEDRLKTADPTTEYALNRLRTYLHLASFTDQELEDIRLVDHRTCATVHIWRLLGTVDFFCQYTPEGLRRELMGMYFLE